MIYHVLSDPRDIKSAKELYMIAKETRHRSCLPTPVFEGRVEALQNCETEQIALPATEKPVNLGFGVRLWTSAISAYPQFESDTASTSLSGRIEDREC